MTITSPVISPRISPCSWCDGSGFEPDPELASLVCTLCDGGRLELISGNLGPTRTCPEGRPFTFNPGTRTLVIVRRRRSETYDLIEFVPDQVPGEAPSRAWEVVKRSDGEVYHVRVGGSWNSCDCKGFTSEATRKGDMRAWENGGEMYFSRGCSHVDATAELIHLGVL